VSSDEASEESRRANGGVWKSRVFVSVLLLGSAMALQSVQVPLPAIAGEIGQVSSVASVVAVDSVNAVPVSKDAPPTVKSKVLTPRPAGIVDPSIATTTTTIAPGTFVTIPLLPVALPRWEPTKIAAVGDLVCAPSGTTTATTCRHRAVSDRIVADGTIRAFLPLGDLVYDNGEAATFNSAYRDSYGRLLAMTHPAPGNHEYGSAALPYFDFFGARAGTAGKGWYSRDLNPAWHLVALNSNCDRVGCGPDSEQMAWLRSDLAASRAPCTIAMWHHPRFSSGSRHGDNVWTSTMWDALANAGAEVVLTGHEHHYERFAPLKSDGSPAPTVGTGAGNGGGLVQFISGAGGKSLYPLGATRPGSEARVENRFGYLEMILGDQVYSWRFIAEDGTVFDQGVGSCQ
jgi:acid phosphatase type 7